MSNAITSLRATEAPNLDNQVAGPADSEPKGSIGRDGLSLSASAKGETEVDQSLLARGTRMVKSSIKVVGDAFSSILEAISSAFVWDALMQQYRAMERARERREQANAEAEATHAQVKALAQESQQKHENARKAH